MQDICIYRIEVQGQVDENDLNAMGPLQVRVVQTDTTTTVFTVYADQSGLVGLLRHLHGRGLILLSVYRER